MSAPRVDRRRRAQCPRARGIGRVRRHIAGGSRRRPPRAALNKRTRLLVWPQQQARGATRAALSLRTKLKRLRSPQDQARSPSESERVRQPNTRELTPTGRTAFTPPLAGAAGPGRARRRGPSGRPASVADARGGAAAPALPSGGDEPRHIAAGDNPPPRVGGITDRHLEHLYIIAPHHERSRAEPPEPLEPPPTPDPRAPSARHSHPSSAPPPGRLRDDSTVHPSGSDPHRPTHRLSPCCP
jgi:hypothetical protein